MKLVCHITLLFILLVGINVYAQKPPSKFGRITIDEMTAKMCPIDSGAHAYFLFDYGYSSFYYGSTTVRSNDDGGKGFQIIFKRHFRIKVLDKQGYDWANIEIPLFHKKSGDEERASQISASTYNLENGKIVETEVRKSEMRTEETTPTVKTIKFAMPNVKEGSIIEVEYTVKSDFIYNLHAWGFQKKVPVLQSDYYVSIPEYFKFNQRQTGYVPVVVEKDNKSNRLTIQYIQQAEGISVQAQKYSQTYTFTEEVSHYKASNIPSFISEDFLKSPSNYISKVEFELEYTKFPNSRMNYYTTSWDKVNEELNEYFSGEIGKANHLKATSAEIAKTGEGVNLMANAFSFIKSKMAWNEYNNNFVTSSLKQSFEAGSGNSAEINLNLVGLLRLLGFEANPMVLSTQDNGFVPVSHPSVSSFDYVVAVVKYQNNTYMMDATEASSEINLLPIRCLNDKGLLVKERGEWLDLSNKKIYGTTAIYKLNLDKSFALKGTADIKYKEYAAYLMRKNIKSYNSQAEFEKSSEKKYPDMSIAQMKIQGLDSLGKPLDLSYNISQENIVNAVNDMAYFSPVPYATVEKNPFKAVKREYPVEFDYPQIIQNVYKITIPEGYVVTEVPKPMIAKLPDNGMKYIYQVASNGNTLDVNLILYINKTTFLPEEYGDLKSFYQLIIEKQKEFVALKKK